MNPTINRKRWERVKPLVKARDSWACTVPGCGSRRSLEVDHRKPVADGGLKYDLSNLQTLCAVHHRNKTRLENTVVIPERERLLAVLERVMQESV